MSITDDTEHVSLADAFTREHRDIDAGIEEHLAAEPGSREAAEPLLRSMEALRRHIYLEEEIVFPHLQNGPLRMPIIVMLREHGELWRKMDALQAQVDAATTGPEVADACRELLALLDTHNSKEEPIIYPHLDADLDEAEQDEVRDLLQSDTLPPGWVCRTA